MKISEFYRDAATLNLNGSIAALFPAILIVGGNLSFFHDEKIFTFVIPFLFYSFVSFQIYLAKKTKSIWIDKNMQFAPSHYQSIFSTNHLLIMYLNSTSPRLLLFYPDGYQAGEIRKYKGKGIGLFSKMYALYNAEQTVIGYFKISNEKIGVFSDKKEYIGCFRKSKRGILKNKKQLLNSSGKIIAEVEGSNAFMDEKVMDKENKPISRLRRGWMPLEWDRYFPEPNTPVLSFTHDSIDQDKLLEMSCVIHEYFVVR